MQIPIDHSSIGKQLVIIFCLLQVSSFGQSSRPKPDSLKAVWKNKSLHDSVRVEAVASLIWDHTYFQPDTALYYSDQLYAFAEKIDKPEVIARALNLRGICHERLGDYSKAINYLTRSLKMWEGVGNRVGVSACWNNIGLIYESLGEFEKAIECFHKCLDISIEYQDTNRIALSMNTLGVMQKWKGRLDSALILHRKGLALARQSNDSYMELLSLSNIGYDYYEMGEYDSAIYYLEEYSRDDNEMPEDNPYVLQFLAKTYHKTGNYEEARRLAEQSLTMAREGKQKSYIKGAAEILHKLYRESGQPLEALEMMELYVSMRDSLENDGNKRELLRQEFQYQYEKQSLRDSLEYAQKEAIKNLELEKHKSDLTRQRFALAGAGSGLLLILSLAYVVYRGKRKSDELLLNILPAEIAQELKKNGKAAARDFETVTILFTDFKEFTLSAEKMKATELVAEIDACFKAFDQICEKHGVEKIKTIGDSYMAAGGLPVPDKNSIANTVNAGLEMATFILNRKRNRESDGKKPFEMRVGIHTGPVVAGIVGVKKFQYDVWGDTVNTASRMESHGEAGKVNISQSTYELIKDDAEFRFEPRGKVEAKGKGEVEMYFVTTHKSNSEPPTDNQSL